MQNTKKFGINNSSTIYNILSEKLYRNPRIAVFRELMTNAVDIHKEIGNDKDAIQIEVPIPENNFLFKIRDFGSGLDPEQVEKIYSNYGVSVKSEKANGQFGIGSKSPFAVNDVFHVTSYKDGIKYHYKMFFEDIPKYILLDMKKTKEKNGLEITVKFKNMITEKSSELLNEFLFAYLPIEAKTQITNEEYFISRLNNFQKEMLKLKKEINENNSKIFIKSFKINSSFRYSTSQDYYSFFEPKGFDTKVFSSGYEISNILLLRYKNVFYPLPADIINFFKDKIFNKFKETFMALKSLVALNNSIINLVILNVSEDKKIIIHPSREKIEENDQNFNEIKSAFSKNIVKIEFLKSIYKYKSDFENLDQVFDFLLENQNTSINFNDVFEIIEKLPKNVIQIENNIFVGSMNSKIIFNTKILTFFLNDKIFIYKKHHTSSGKTIFKNENQLSEFFTNDNNKINDYICILNQKNHITKFKKIHQYFSELDDVRVLVFIEDNAVFERIKKIFPNLVYWKDEYDKKYKELQKTKTNKINKKETQNLEVSEIIKGSEKVPVNFTYNLNLPVKRTVFRNKYQVKSEKSMISYTLSNLIKEIYKIYNLNIEVNLSYYQEKNDIKSKLEEIEVDFEKFLYENIFKNILRKKIKPYSILDKLQSYKFSYSEKLFIERTIRDIAHVYLMYLVKNPEIKANRNTLINKFYGKRHNISQSTLEILQEFIEDSDDFEKNILLPRIHFEDLKTIIKSYGNFTSTVFGNDLSVSMQNKVLNFIENSKDNEIVKMRNYTASLINKIYNLIFKKYHTKIYEDTLQTYESSLHAVLLAFMYQKIKG